jgi:hypothetical protein
MHLIAVRFFILSCYVITVTGYGISGQGSIPAKALPRKISHPDQLWSQLNKLSSISFVLKHWKMSSRFGAAEIIWTAVDFCSGGKINFKNCEPYGE